MEYFGHGCSLPCPLAIVLQNHYSCMQWHTLQPGAATWGCGTSPTKRVNREQNCPPIHSASALPEHSLGGTRRPDTERYADIGSWRAGILVLARGFRAFRISWFWQQGAPGERRQQEKKSTSWSSAPLNPPLSPMKGEESIGYWRTESFPVVLQRLYMNNKKNVILNLC